MKVSIAALSILFLTAVYAPAQLFGSAQPYPGRGRWYSPVRHLPDLPWKREGRTPPDPLYSRACRPERIYAALTTGVMQEQAKALTDAEKRSIAEYLAGRKLGVENGDAKSMPNGCPGNASIRDLTSRPSWNGWGLDMSNTRFQPARAAGLSPGQVSG